MLNESTSWKAKGIFLVGFSSTSIILKAYDTLSCSPEYSAVSILAKQELLPNIFMPRIVRGFRSLGSISRCSRAGYPEAENHARSGFNDV